MNDFSSIIKAAPHPICDDCFWKTCDLVPAVLSPWQKYWTRFVKRSSTGYCNRSLPTASWTTSGQVRNKCAHLAGSHAASKCFSRWCSLFEFQFPLWLTKSPLTNIYSLLHEYRTWSSFSFFLTFSKKENHISRAAKCRAEKIGRRCDKMYTHFPNCIGTHK